MLTTPTTHRIVFCALLTIFAATDAAASSLTVSSSLTPGTVLTGTVTGGFTVPTAALQGNDITSAYALFNFVDDGDVQLTSSIAIPSIGQLAIYNTYWNERERIGATLAGGETASGESQWYSFTNQYSFSYSFPCGPSCTIPFTQTVQDLHHGYTGAFSVYVPLGPASIAQMTTGFLPFTLQVEGDAFFLSDSLVATLSPTPIVTAAPEPSSAVLVGLGLVVSRLRTRRRPADARG